MLRNMVFYNPQFLCSALNFLFRHDLSSTLKYNQEKHFIHFATRSEFDAQLTRFTQTGIMDPKLLKCIWQPLGLNKETFHILVQILILLELCYKCSNLTLLRFPWFVDKEDTKGICERQFQKSLPAGMLQYSLYYSFSRRIPSTIYERLCVRFQLYLLPGAHMTSKTKY